MIGLPYFVDYQFVVAAAPSLSADFYRQFFPPSGELKGNISENTEGVEWVENATYNLLENATAALVKSGTSTLETALFGVPQVVCYKGSKASYAIARRLVNVKFISLVNLIADREIVKELIQDDLTTENLVAELRRAIDNQQVIKKNYEILRGQLGNAGASERTATLMFHYLKLAASH